MLAWHNSWMARHGKELAAQIGDVGRAVSNGSRSLAALAIVAQLASVPAEAFCGFYVAQADSKLFNASSKVVLARDGDETAITMASDYQGDAKEFALVVPVPTFIERKQIGDRNIGASRYANLGRRRWRSMWRPDITEPGVEGDKARYIMKTVAEVEQRKTNEMVGAELGYRYVDSPIIMRMPGGPEHLFREYIPTTWPGARLPHVWLNDGSAMQDLLPKEGYTLLRLGGTGADTSQLEAAIRAYGAPLTVLDVPDTIARDLYAFDLLLLRPDMHVVWRGNAVGDMAAEIAAVATGH